MSPFEDARPQRQDAGFSILEVVISLVILLTVLVSVSSLMVTAFKVGANSRFRQAATEIATSTLDSQVRDRCRHLARRRRRLVPAVGDERRPGLLGRARGVHVPTGSAGCQSPEGNGEAMLKVTVWVTWAEGEVGRPVVESRSRRRGRVCSSRRRHILAVPARTSTRARARILVTVDDAAGNGVEGVVVTATDTPTGTTTLTATTTSSGCALFTNIAPGDAGR